MYVQNVWGIPLGNGTINLFVFPLLSFSVFPFLFRLSFTFPSFNNVCSTTVVQECVSRNANDAIVSFC